MIARLGQGWREAFSEPRTRRVLAEVIAVALVVGTALFLRAYRLDSLPAGLHGDEAVAGLEGQHILRDGWIGPYSPLARGQPAGPLYLVAPAIKALGNTAFATRLVPALMGTLTVLVLYFAIKSRFGRREGILAAVLLATMGWHLLLTRTGFPVGSWPLVTLLAAWALSEAIRRESIAWYAVAGALTAAGIYVYNAHYVVIGAFLLLLVGLLIARRYRPLGRDLLCVAAFACGLVLVALPMVGFAADGANGYFQHFRAESIASTPTWDKHDTPLAKTRLLATRYGDAWLQLTVSPKIDGVDGTGVTQILPLTLAGLAFAGAATGLRRRRNEPLIWIGLVIIAVAPAAAALSNEQGVARRTLEMTPCIAMFAALALAEFARFLERRGRRLAWRAGSAAVTTGVIVLCAWQGIVPYFTTFADSSAQRWVYAADFTAATRFMETLKPGDYVYLASDRQSINYESRQFLAPDVQGEDIGSRDPAQRFVYFPARGRPVFILLGRFRADLPQLELQHPGGKVLPGPAGTDGAAFIAYELPPNAALP
ncbi:glycosyltransferase family 39 protein [bacterium]|nr:glycosyltransferase family 39 protein [bacterium]